MPRRTHSTNTRPAFNSYATFEDLHNELHKQWARWRQKDNETAKARQQQKLIDQISTQYRK